MQKGAQASYPAGPAQASQARIAPIRCDASITKPF